MDRNGARYSRSKVAKTTLVVLAVASFLPTVLFAKSNDAQLVDRIAAIVNSHPILYSEARSKVQRGQTVIISHFPAKDDASDFEKALQDQINFELILQRVEELELTIDESEVDAEIQRFLKGRNLTMAGLQEALAEQGMTYSQYKEDFTDQMIIRKFQGRVINPLIKITDKDLESYYLKRVGSTSENVNIKLRQIFIKIPSNASDAVVAAKKARAQTVHEKIESGLAFAEAAKIYSDLTGATENGGEMPSMQLSDLAQHFRKFLSPLAVGEFTAPIETPAGFYIFYMEAKQFGGSSEFAKQKDRLEYELRTQELANQTRRWLAEQRRRSKITVID